MKMNLQITRTSVFGIPVKFIKFLVVGGINTLFSLVVYLILVYFGIHYILASLIATVLGILFNFKTYGTLVFKNKDNSLILRFFLVYTITYIIGISCLKLMLIIGLNKYTAGLILTIPNALLGYFLNRRFVFNRKTSSS